MRFKGIVDFWFLRVVNICIKYILNYFFNWDYFILFIIFMFFAISSNDKFLSLT